MPKVKVPRKSTHIDMTAMCDVAFLLLTFFMLTTKFRPEEPFIVDTPSSVSEIKLPETDIMTISIDKDGRVFYSIDGQFTRKSLIERMSSKYNVKFTPEQIHQFTLLQNFGLPVAQLPQFLDMKPNDRSKVFQAGVPADSLNNELADWIWFGRLSNNNVRIAVKGDRETNYPIVKQIIATLQDKKVNKFNFITSLETGEE